MGEVFEYFGDTGESVMRDMTAAEIAQQELDAQQTLAIKVEAAEKEVARLALLDRLGISADEAKLLLG